MADPDIPKWNLWARLDPGLRPLVLIFLIITTCYALVFNGGPLPDGLISSYDTADLSRDLASDQEQVLERIKNRSIEIKGLLAGADSGPSTYLLLADKHNPDTPRIRCDFEVLSRKVYSQLAIGQEIVVAGVWRGKMEQGLPVFTQCRINSMP